MELLEHRAQPSNQRYQPVVETPLDPTQADALGALRAVFAMALGCTETSSLMTDFLRQAGGAAVIDGGLATELERHGADLNDPLWSAKCLLTSSQLIRAVLSLSFSWFSKKSWSFGG